MAYQYGVVKIQLRRDTAANLSTVVLASGEPAYATDTEVLKIGNGSDNFATLSGIAGGGGGGGSTTFLGLGDTPSSFSGAGGYTLRINSGATAVEFVSVDPLVSGNNVSLLNNDSGYITAVADDTSPFLGGELNLDNNDIVIDCKNDSGSDILVGTPVYVSGYYANGKSLIAPADASSSSTMPAIGIVNSTITNGSEGTVGIMGVVKGFNTNSFEVGDTIYTANGGGLTNTRPTGISDLIQNLGRVLRKDASHGRVILLGAGRSNDVPNATTFIGDVEAASFTKTGGTSSQFLKADGSVDSSTYITSDTGVAGGGTSVANIVIIGSGEYAGITPNSGTLYYVTG